MGIATLHNNNSVNTAIASMNDDMTSGNKRSLLDSLYALQANGGTPLRSALYNCGLYLECTSNSLFNVGGSNCPVLSSSAGGNCQQNFIIAMTDGFYNSSFYSLNNEDGDDDTSYDGGAYADTYSDTLADIAMYFYERDLHTSLNNDVPAVGIDTATHQHVTTMAVAFGVDGSITTDPTDPTVAFSWPNPSSSAQALIDDLRHAGYNGRGGFVSARDPRYSGHHTE